MQRTEGTKQVRDGFWSKVLRRAAGTVRSMEALEERTLLSAAVVNPINDFAVPAGTGSTVIDLSTRFTEDDIEGTVARFASVLGNIDVELFDSETPLTVANFLNYLANSRYENSIIHRSVPGFVIQGGGFYGPPDYAAVQTFGTVQNEPGISNLRGTIAMAKIGGNPNSATSQWFFNLANNSSNLDTQNGGFTVFGRVLGDGMSVVDAIAALPRQNLGGALEELPVRNFSGGDVTADNVVSFTSIFVIDKLVYTVTTDAPGLVTPVVNGSVLTLTYANGASGPANVTVRATSVADGTFVEDTFTVQLASGTLSPPVVGEVRPSEPVVAVAGDTVRLNVRNVQDDGSVVSVSYFRDVNGNGSFDPGVDVQVGSSTNASTGYAIDAATAGLNPGTIVFFAIAQDNEFQTSTAAATSVRLNAPSQIQSVTSNKSTFKRKDRVTLTAVNPTDADGTVRGVQFFADTNGNNVIDESDVFLGSGRKNKSNWILSTKATNFPGGTYSILATAEDNDGVFGQPSARSVTVQNEAPTIGKLRPKNGTIREQGEPLILNVNKPQDKDGTVVAVEYYRDANGNRRFDPGVDVLIDTISGPSSTFTASINSQTLPTGDLTIFARARDNDGLFGPAVSAKVRINAPPTIAGLTADRTEVGGRERFTLTVPTFSDPNGPVRHVRFYMDSGFFAGVFDERDRSIGSAKLRNGVWTATIRAALLDSGVNRIWAIAQDGDGGRSQPISIQITVVPQ